MNFIENHYKFSLGALFLAGSMVVLLCWMLLGKSVSTNLELVFPLWDITIAAIVGFLILASIFFWPIPNSHKKHLVILWIIRMILAFGIMLFYESHFTTIDAITYYNVGITQHFSSLNIGFGHGTDLIEAYSILINKIIPKSYYTMKIISSLFGFWAIYIFYKAACIFWEKDDIRLLYFLALFPNILFWSSIFGKDSFTLFGIAIYSYGVVSWFVNKKASHFVYIIMGIFIASAIRPWLGIIFVMPLSIFVLMGKYSKLKKTFFLLFIAITGIIVFRIFMSKFGITSINDLVSITDYMAHGWNRGGAGQTVQHFNSLTDMILFMPFGAFTALFRPLPGELLNPFGLLSGLQDAFLLLLIARFAIKKNWTRLNNPLIIWLVCTVIAWACVYGFVSSQNLGTAVRFKLQIMPILLLLLLYLNCPKSALSTIQKPFPKS